MSRQQEMLQQLPPFMRRDPTTQELLRVAAEEIDLLEAQMDELIANYYPHTAEAFIDFWEKLFRLPVNPPGKTTAQRRKTVTTFLRRMSAGGRGSNWVARLEDLIGAKMIYLTNTPQDIKGLVWERFLGGIGADLEWRSGVESSLSWLDPSGFNPGDPGATVYWLEYPTLLIDAEVLIQFSPGAETSGEVAAVLKDLGGGTHLQVVWSGGKLLVQKVASGSATTLGEATATLTPGKRYWLRAWIREDAFKGEVWAEDPSKDNGGEPLFTKSVELASEDAETWGTNVEGRAGLWWSGAGMDWLIRQVRINEVGAEVPANTLRITIPYEEGSYQALETILLARSITPANTEIQVFNDVGFVLGISQLGVQGF